MTQLIDVAAQFPTAIYSVLLGIVVIYWIIGMFGIVDLDLTGDADVEVDTDVDVNGSVGGLAGLMLTFGLTGIPFTLVISIITLICWLLSYYMQHYLLSWLPDGWLYYLFGAVASFIVFLISLPITAVIIRPLKGMFKSVETTTSQHLVGRDATIATGHVTDSFGQAKLFNDGAEILLDVRCAPEHSLKMGDKVLLIDYSKENHTYIVAPYS